MRVRYLLLAPVSFGLAALAACTGDDVSNIPALDVEAITAVLAPGADARPLKLNHSGLVPIWTVSKDQELSCGGSAVAGGEVGGGANFTHFGASWVNVSAAWDIGNLITTPPQYQAVGPAGGPVAPVIGTSGYPYAFHYDPATGSCQQTVSATGNVEVTAANGDRLFGEITGGEAHRLDFILPGDGVETFAEVAVTGGTGRFSDAGGSFVVHTIARIQPTLNFAITLAEIMPGGTIGY
jgi:hypothetical protein